MTDPRTLTEPELLVLHVLARKSHPALAARVLAHIDTLPLPKETP